MDDNAGVTGTTWAAACDEALMVLNDALTWMVPAQSWELMRECIADIVNIAPTANSERLWQVISEVELCGPSRVRTRAGDMPPLPAPKAARDQIAEAAAALTSARAPAPDVRAGQDQGSRP